MSAPVAIADRIISPIAGMVNRLRLGFPGHYYQGTGLPGDDLMCSAVFRELKKRGVRSMVAATPHRALFQNNPDGQLRPTSDARSWMPVEETALLAVLKDVREERHGEDCRARLEYSSYGTFDTSLVRQIVLTKEGVLAVRDDILPGASADGLPAFTLWQMYSIDSESTNRFTSLGECAYPSCDLSDTNRYRRGMSVYFSGPAGTTCGKQVIPNGRLRNYQDIQRDLNLRTAYARLTLQAGKPASLDLLVVPHSPAADPAQLDTLTSTEQDEARSTFRTVCDGQPVQIEIRHDGGWLVSRPAAKSP